MAHAELPSLPLELGLADAEEFAERACPLPLHELPIGARAVLGPPDSMTPTVFRLLEMGFTPGAVISIVRRAPGGDPIEVRVRGTRLCVRRADLARFSVTSVQLAPPKSRAGK